MKEIITCFILIITAYSCIQSKKSLVYNDFAVQISPNEKFKICKYTRSGAMAFSSYIHSTEIFEINKEFIEGSGKKINGVISHWITNDTLLIYNFNSKIDQPTDTLPIKTELENIDDIVLKTEYYRPNSWGGNTYTLDSIWTNDYGIFVKFKYNDVKYNIRSYPFGSVTITTNNDIIESVEAFGGIRKSMNFVYKNSDGSYSTNLPGIGLTTNKYVPTKNIEINQLEKNKIYYQRNEILPLTVDIRS